ncbi:MAG: hypothetical protein ABS61_00080 [Microbacterium sp. SCN 70-18]|nr:MAG: hypothetical protein ABS61_00080 [Microbacterium sp. SCN 70-18]
MFGSAAFAGILPGDTVFLGLLSAHPAIVLARAVGAVLLGVALWRRRPPLLRLALRVCAAGAAVVSVAVLLASLGGSSHPLPITEAGIAAAVAAVAGTAAAMLSGATDSPA